MGYAICIGDILMKHSLITRLKMLKIRDFISGLKLIFSLPLLPIFYFINKNLWLVCESENEARDNGYWFFKYICEKHPETNVIYAINKKSVDYNKVAVLGKTCQYGSIMHWVYYLIAKYNISTQKGGKPNAAICYVLELSGLLNNRRIFLQHGITYNDAEWLYYNNTKMRLFLCGAKPEYDYVMEKFGYPAENVKYVGFCRFDNLINTEKTNKKSRIVVMPTWREWLVTKTEMTKIANYDGNFFHTKYYKCWNEFITNDNLISVLEENDIELIFFPHRNMQVFLHDFHTNSENIILGSWENYDIQALIINSDIMITDYSSVLFDYAYLKKPLLFYQFDYEDFIKGQYRPGYFRFDNQKLGVVCNDMDSICDNIKNIIKNNYSISVESSRYIDSFFELRDNKNCERTYEEILKL